MRGASYFVFSILFLLGFSSCEKGTNQGNSGKVTITFWHSCVSSTVPALNALIGRFEQEHPGIEVKAQYVPTGDALIQKLITSVQSHTAPDISWIHANFLQSIIEADAIYKMSEFMHGTDSLSSSDSAEIFPPLMEEAKWRGTLYSLPMEATGLALTCDKELLARAGLDSTHGPRTWEELREYARLLTVDKNGDGKIDQYGFFVPVFPASGPLGDWMVWQFYPFLFEAGGDVINKEQTQVLYNSPAGVAALTLWKEIYQETHLASFGTDYEPAFASKELAMALDGPWNLPRWKEIQGLSWMICPLPKGPVKQATIIGGEYLAIFKQSQHPKEAWAFVKWMTTPEVQAQWSMTSGYLPIRRAVWKIKAYTDYLETHPNLKTYVQQMEVAQAASPIDYNPLKISRHLAEAIEKATVGGADPKTVLDEAAAKSNALLRQTAANH